MYINYDSLCCLSACNFSFRKIIISSWFCHFGWSSPSLGAGFPSLECILFCVEAIYGVVPLHSLACAQICELGYMVKERPWWRCSQMLFDGGRNNCLISDLVTQAVLICSLYQSKLPSHDHNFKLLTSFLAKLAYLSMLFIFELPCIANSEVNTSQFHE